MVILSGGLACSGKKCTSLIETVFILERNLKHTNPLMLATVFVGMLKTIVCVIVAMKTEVLPNQMP